MASSRNYDVDSVGSACDVLRVLAQSPHARRLHEIAAEAGISRPRAFRLLATLQSHGMVIKTSSRAYLSSVALTQPRTYRIGYAAQTSQFGFSRAVTRSIVESAKAAGLELIILDNAYSPRIALENADRFLKDKIDLILEFQSDAQVAPLISSRLSAKRIPLIAIEIPHPNATYFGVNNCQAGLTAGRYLGRWAQAEWKGVVEEVILLGLPKAGPIPEGRLTGSLLGIREILPNLLDSKIVCIDGDGGFELSMQAISQYLRKTKARRILVSAINDPSALGALEAFRAAGRLDDCAVVGQNGSFEARIEMRRSGSRLIGSVGYFPEKYGESLIRTALDLLSHRAVVPQAIFIKHALLTPGNLKQYYARESRDLTEDEAGFA